MSQVYKFFGFGQNFIKLLETLGKGRNACIAFSPAFDLKCGRAQGNTSSPTEYNMGQQILLFKIELCPEIRSVYYSHFIARPFSDRAFEFWIGKVRIRSRIRNIFQSTVGERPSDKMAIVHTSDFGAQLNFKKQYLLSHVIFCWG